MAGKGNEDLKAKIAKIQSKAKAQAPAMPAPDIEQPEAEEAEEPTMEALEAEFEAKKKALQSKVKTPVKAPQPEAEETDDEAGIETAIEEYSNEGKFRVELIFQLVQLNKSFKEIATTLQGLTQNDE